MQLDSIKKIALAWILTLPVTLLLSGVLLYGVLPWFFGLWVGDPCGTL